MRRPLLALAILLTIADHGAAQTSVIPLAPGRGHIVLPPSRPAGLVLPKTSGRFTVLTPGLPPFVVLPQSFRGFAIVPFSDPPEDSGLPCCNPP
jgi:hypothetical protein